MVIQIYVISLSFDSPSNFHTIYNDFNLTVFDGLSNGNEIAWNLNDHQFRGRRTHLSPLLSKCHISVLFIKNIMHTTIILGQQTNPRINIPSLERPTSEQHISTNWAENFLVWYRSAH
jgi:hypothetical protein